MTSSRLKWMLALPLAYLGGFILIVVSASSRSYPQGIARLFSGAIYCAIVLHSWPALLLSKMVPGLNEEGELLFGFLGTLFILTAIGYFAARQTTLARGVMFLLAGDLAILLVAVAWVSAFHPAGSIFNMPGVGY